MEYLSIIATVAVIHLLAVISPGPDFMMITRSSLIYSRRTGMYSAIGLGLGILVHVAYSLVGIGLVISQSIVLFTIIKYLGAIYLIYIGYKSLTAKLERAKDNEIVMRQGITPLKAIRIGFLTNVLNPKATLFFLSLFTLVISPNTPLFVKLIMSAEMSIVTAGWFMLIAFIFSHHLFKNEIQKVQHIAERFIGIALILLGLKVAFSTSK
jgi:RhtB (resistance to homoserine/threonine) family protein